MNPHAQFCHNPACSASGQRGLGNITVHSRKERRYSCKVCHKTFAATHGTAFYRLQTAPDWVALVLGLLTWGCPPQAIVAVLGFDERTVARWQLAAGAQCQRFHEHWTREHPLELAHVQADELRVKIVSGVRWMALAIAVEFRLWLGGVISEQRNEPLITALVRQVRRVACHPRLLIAVDGCASYVTAVRKVFRRPVYTGKVGRPPLEPEAGWMLGQVVKQYARKRVIGVTRRIVQGTGVAIARVLEQTNGGTVLNTAFIERLNATFRSRLVPLVRRGRALARTQARLEAGMYLVGCAYNFCWYHESLRLPAPAGADRKWIERTPAMAAGLTPQRWSLAELLNYAVPPAKPEPVRRRRGRRQPSAAQEWPLAA